MIGFIITGHGNFASGLYSACKLLNGEYSNVEIIDFIDGDSIDDLDFKINNSINKLSNYEKIIVFCDLFAGSPFNRMMINIIDDIERYTVLAGVNLPILIEGLVQGQACECDYNNLVNNLKILFAETFVDGTLKLFEING